VPIRLSMLRLWPLVGLALLATRPVLAQQHEHDHSHTREPDVHSHRGPGPHFIDAFHTENAYLERKIRPDVFYRSAEDADVVTANLEVEWAVVSRVALILHAPVHSRRPAEGGRETGLGDLSLGAKVALVHRPRLVIVSTGLDLTVPSGDEDRGLGAGHAALEPFALAWLPFGPARRWSLQAAGHLDVPLAGDEAVGAEVSAALSWTSPLGITPLIEGITEFPVEGGGRANWWVAPGIRWEFAPSWEVGGSLRVGLSGPEVDEEDYQVAFGLIRHFALPR
jgi:Putative MetA-pathway of phenol degradation